jgi:hypothetical protein
MSTLPTVFMYGGGRQSVCITALVIEGKLPYPDYTIISDTGREKQTTWDYLENYVQPEYAKPIHRINKDDFATVDLWGGKEKDTLLIPAFTNINGKLGKMETFCSNEWKARVCDRFLKRVIGIKDWVSWIGFSSDEPRRYNAKRRSMGDKVWFPLVDGFPTTKEGCIDTVLAHGWPKPIHSACWMCPLQDDNDRINNTPDDHAKAIAFDDALRERDPNVFIHRSLKPYGQVELVKGKKQSEPCDSGLCML